MGCGPGGPGAFHAMDAMAGQLVLKWVQAKESQGDPHWGVP